MDFHIGLPNFDEPFGSRFLKIFLGEPILVDVRVILLVEDDKMDEYIYIQYRVGDSWGLDDLHMYAHDVHRCSIVSGLSHQLPKFGEPFGSRFLFWNFFWGNRDCWCESILLVKDDKMDGHIHPHKELETLRVLITYMCMHMMGMDATCINK